MTVGLKYTLARSTVDQVAHHGGEQFDYLRTSFQSQQFFRLFFGG
jgi:hypothetical protein